jgi:hypothetical protein
MTIIRISSTPGEIALSLSSVSDPAFWDTRHPPAQGLPCRIVEAGCVARCHGAFGIEYGAAWRASRRWCACRMVWSVTKGALSPLTLGIQPALNSRKSNRRWLFRGFQKRTAAFRVKRLVHADLCMNRPGSPQTTRAPVLQWPSVPLGERRSRRRSRCECKHGLPPSRDVASLESCPRGQRELPQESFRRSTDAPFDRTLREKQWCERGLSPS